MKNNFALILLITMIAISCKQNVMVKEQENMITKENRETPDFSKGIFTEEIMWYLGRLSNPQVSPDQKSVLFSVKYFDYTKNRGNQELYTISLGSEEPVKITATVADEHSACWRPDGKKIAYLLQGDDGSQIWEANPDGSEAKQLTKIDGDINGFSYSPDMKHILYTMSVQIDPKIVDRYPDLPEANAMIYDELMYRHWDSWKDGTYEHLFIADYPSLEKSTELMSGERFSVDGIGHTAWHPDGTKVVYCSKKMSGKAWAESTNSDLYIYDMNSKKTINLTEENKGYDYSPRFSPDGTKIVWWSMKKDGYESDKHRLFIHDFSTGISKDYTADFDQNATDFVWNREGDKVYFLSCIEATHQIYLLDILSGEIKKLTEGDHDFVTLSLAGDLLLAIKTTHALPAELFTVNPENGEERQLTFINQDVLSKITLAKTEKRWIKTTDGKEMLTWVIYPPNFDPAKQYPALLYCQGGPQQSVSQFFSYRWNFQIMAAHDYIIVAPNRRGLPGFGTEWNEQISLDYGGQNMKDYLSAIDKLAEEPFIDKERLGAVGASYGGFSVYWLAGNHQKRFKAFIAHCGMFNFESWYGTTEELFFANHDLGGPYWQKPTPASYNFSPHRFVGNWDTPLLVIHGGNDFRIPYTEGIQAFNAAQIQNIASRFLFFPEENHFVSRPQNSILWQREFFAWFDRWLK